MDPPAHAVVLSIDEKSQIQALDRAQPGLLMKKGRCGAMTHDYIRNGTTRLFAALNVLDGKLVHAIADNYATHKNRKVREWLVRHLPWMFHFTPTSASWLNAVEGYFAKLTKRRLRRGVFRSIIELQAAIKRFLAETNADPRPFRWTKDPDKIIAAVKRGHQVLDSIHSHVRRFKLQTRKFLALVGVVQHGRRWAWQEARS
jgi:transposase